MLRHRRAKNLRAVLQRLSSSSTSSGHAPATCGSWCRTKAEVGSPVAINGVSRAESDVDDMQAPTRLQAHIAVSGVRLHHNFLCEGTSGMPSISNGAGALSGMQVFCCHASGSSNLTL